MKQSFAMVGKNSLIVHIPETPEEMETGYIDGSPRDGEAMVFQVSEVRLIPISMEDMKIPLDILWINKGRIDTIVENFSGRIVAAIGTMAVEVPAGYVQRAQIKRDEQFIILADGPDIRPAI
jgi:uncharacterized membrane protein (UPF0127 family)